VYDRSAITVMNPEWVLMKLIFIRGLVDPRAMIDSEGICH